MLLLPNLNFISYLQLMMHLILFLMIFWSRQARAAHLLEDPSFEKVHSIWIFLLFFRPSTPHRSSSGFKICKGVTAKMLLMHLCKNYMQLLLEALEYKAKRRLDGIKNILTWEDPTSFFFFHPSSALFAAAAAWIKMFLKVKIERHRPSTNDFRKLSKLRKISMLLHAFLRCIL